MAKANGTLCLRRREKKEQEEKGRKKKGRKEKEGRERERHIERKRRKPCPYGLSASGERLPLDNLQCVFKQRILNHRIQIYKYLIKC